MKTFYEILSRGNKKAEIFLYRPIGSRPLQQVSADEFGVELRKLGKLDEIDVRIDSPGGSPFQALAMYNTLRRNGAKIITYVDGLAASAASLVFAAGDIRRMASNAMLMIHNPMVDIDMATSSEMRKAADVMDKVRGTLLDTYVRASTLDEKTVSEMMDAETWMNAADALANGFSHETTAELRMVACAEKEMLAKFKHAPQSLLAVTQPQVTKPYEKIELMRAKLRAKSL